MTGERSRLQTHIATMLSPVCCNYAAAARWERLDVDLQFFLSGGLSQPPSLSAVAMHASRNSSATVRSTSTRAMTMPPMDNAAIASAVTRRWRSLSIKLRSKTLTIALNTVSKARRAVFPVRVGEEARNYFGIKVALAFEVAIKSAVRQAGS